MWIISAPYPFVQNAIIFESPDMRDTETLDSQVGLLQAASGKLYTHVTRKGRTYSFAFFPTRVKALEFFNFYDEFSAERWLIERTEGPALTGWIKLNPLQLEMVRRGATCDNNDTVSLSFEFET